MMYEDLAKRLRTCGSSLSCIKCKWSPDCGGTGEVLRKAADAIEDLQEKLDDARMDASEWAESLEYMSAAKVELEEQTRWIPVAEENDGEV